MYLLSPQAFFLALGITTAPVGGPTSRPSRDMHDSEPQIRRARVAAGDRLTALFQAQLAKLDDVTSAFDAVLRDPGLCELLALPNAPPSETLQAEAKRAIQERREAIASEPSARVRVAALSAVDDFLRFVDLLPRVIELGKRIELLAVSQGEELPSTAEIIKKMLVAASDPEIPPRVAAGSVGSVAGPIALHVLGASRATLTEDQAAYLADVAAEGWRDALRLHIALLESFAVDVAPEVFPPDDRMVLEREVLRHRERTQLLTDSASRA